MWAWPIWGALSVGGAAGTAALTLFATRARRVWHEFRDTRRDVVRRLGELAKKAETTAGKAAAVGDTPELEESVGRLRASIARLDVLRSALDEARITFGPVAVVFARR